MKAFTNQSQFDVRCEWGLPGVAALEGCRTFIVVDVLSFSTCVAIAAGRGVEVAPCPPNDHEAAELARRLQATVAGPRGAIYSLSPASVRNAPQGLRLVLPSPNGAMVSVAAAAHGAVLAGCLRNRAAVVRRAVELGGPFGVVPAGERWPDHTLRPAFEDLLGAGAIAAALPGSRSPEATAAVASFEAVSDRLRASLMVCSSGRELVERGFPDDVLLAAELDVETVAPQLNGDCFVR